MPRTKVAKSAAKRVREVDEIYETKITNFDTRVSFLYQDIDQRFGDQFDKLEDALEHFRNKIPKEIREMTIGELKRTNLSTFAEVVEFVQAENPVLNTTSLCVPRDDEGYLTEASSTSSASRHTAGQQRQTTAKKGSLIGPLSSARARSRRSRSADPLQTPSVLQSIRAKKPVSAMKQAAAARHQQQLQQAATHPPHHSLDDSVSSTNSAARMSRSKFRTPSGRTKAASADRIASITPKVQMGTPIAILRYARMGETLISASGSPVAGLPAISDTANIAIPLADGVISVRPTSMGEFDRNLLHRIDPATLTQLKKLQDNLNQMIRGFNKQD